MSCTTNETYTGNTTVNGGTLFLTGNASINNSTNITLRSGATIDVSGRVNSLLTLGGQTLAGGGTVNGSLSNAVGSTVVAGGQHQRHGRHIDRHQQRLAQWHDGDEARHGTTSPTTCSRWAATCYLGGTLNVTNISATPLAVNDSFKLFAAGTYGGFCHHRAGEPEQ